MANKTAQPASEGKTRQFNLTAKVWKYAGPAGWYFVNLGKKESRIIKWMEGKSMAGWGYVRVRAHIGKTAWETTLFPSKAGIYMMAIKADVRKKEKIVEHQRVNVRFSLI